MKLIIAAVYVISIAYVHLRGRVRHKLGRQLSDHSTFLAPINCFLYLFSRMPNKPYLNPADFPDLSPLQAHWEEIRFLRCHDAARASARSGRRRVGATDGMGRGVARKVLISERSCLQAKDTRWERARRPQG